ncbi:MAG: helix-turn-helix transcriptional regulator [Candidatus Eisenbacteria bacterium]|nr:helix-turn-helix transcriptional regulator [Candidatus Eisenbacteria bacterium]MCC7144362.1 helix-turn-helix transcriptional regulator [Candidatus Eisenbacteria bacterium]
MRTRLKVLRAERDLTQAELADKLSFSRNTINSIETGRFVPSVVTALRIAVFFEKPVEEIFILEPEDQP